MPIAVTVRLQASEQSQISGVGPDLGHLHVRARAPVTWCTSTGPGTSPCAWVAATHRRPADRNGRAEDPDEWLVRSTLVGAARP